MKLSVLNFVAICCAVLFSIGASAQLEFPEDKVSWKFTVEQKGDEATIIGTITMVEHWHIYAANLPKGNMAIPTGIELKKTDKFQIVGGVIEPKPIFVHDELADEDLYYHSNTIKMKRKIKVLSEDDFTLNGVFSFQTCDDSHCLPPYEAEFTVKIKGVKQEQSSTDPIVPENTTNDGSASDDQALIEDKPEDKPEKNAKSEDLKPTEKKEEKSSNWGVFILAFLSGFAALIMPCVFPMIPMTVSFFTKRSKSRAEGIRNAMIYGGSIVLIHVLLGALVVVTGSSSLLNEMSTNVWFNLLFFIMLFVFGLSFLGAFEIQLPSKWVNAADAKADKGGVVGIFFMALVLSLASFSCTGPILGNLLVGISSEGGGSALILGMFAFGLALALPFMLFSIFPAWLNSMPSSGGWLNVVKVFLGFIEIAFSFKFLSTVDTTLQLHLLEREVFIAIQVAIFLVLALYMLGKIRLPHDSIVEKLSVGRAMIASFVLAFAIYLLPGMWGAPLTIVNAYLPPDFYAETPGGLISAGNSGSHNSATTDHVDGMHKGPQGLMAFTDYDKALRYAKEVNKPLFIDFTGWGCVNCRKMENSVWGQDGIIQTLRDDVVIVSLYVDERTELPKGEQKTIKLNGRDYAIKTIGNKWTAKQINEYQTSSQPYYVMQYPDGTDIPIGSADYQNHGDPKVFKNWLDSGVKAFKEN